MAAGSAQRDRDEALNLYLDDRLPPAERAAFERRLQGDAGLRAAIEFHRGLTLEFREETPALPRNYDETARRRFERAEAGLRDDEPTEAGEVRPLSAAGRHGLRRAATGAVLLLLLLALGYLLRQGRAPSRVADSEPGDPAGREAAGAEPTPDAQTLEALRSLGYIAGGEAIAPRPPAAAPTRAPAASAVATPRATVSPSPAAQDPIAARHQPPATPAAPAATPEAATTEHEAEPAAMEKNETEPPGAGPIAYRWLEVGRAPALGRDHEIIRNAAAWQELAGAPDAPVDFGVEMAVVLRHRLGSDPPSRLVPVSVTRTSAAIRIECRVERDDPAATPPASPGQVLILPASDRPILIVMH